MAKLISFDIDGTLEVGDPRGSVTLDMIRKVIDKGYIVGSCSVRPISYQRRIWEQNGIDMDFTILKDELEIVKDKFVEDSRHLHSGI